MRVLSSLLGVLLLSNVVLGCSGDDDGAPPANAPASTPVADEAPAPANDAPTAFEVDAPNDVLVRAGGEATFAVTTKSGIAIAIDDLPPGVTAKIDGANVTLVAAADASLGDHAIVVRGDAGGASKKIARTIIVAGKPGTLDPTFAEQGTLVGLKGYLTATGADAAGNVYVGGTLYAGTAMSMVARYLPNGEPDKSYGQGGFTTLAPAGSTSTEARIAVNPDGSVIVLVTRWPVPAYGESCVTKIDAKGAVDTTFGTAGWACFAQPAPINVYSRFLHVLPDGSILAGSTVSSGVTTPYVEKLTPQGKRDESFGKDGFLVLPTAMILWIAGIDHDAQGHVVVALGGEEGGTYKNWILRFTKAGQPDPYFNQLGTPGKVSMSFGAMAASVKGMTVGPNDEIFLTGGGNTQVLFAGLDDKGAPLASIGAGGYRTHPVFAGGQGNMMSFVSGKVVTSGAAKVEGAGTRSMFLRVDASTGEMDSGFANNGADYIAKPTFYGQTAPLARRGRLLLTTSDTMGMEPYTVIRVWQ